MFNFKLVGSRKMLAQVLMISFLFLPRQVMSLDAGSKKLAYDLMFRQFSSRFSPNEIHILGADGVYLNANEFAVHYTAWIDDRRDHAHPAQNHLRATAVFKRTAGIWTLQEVKNLEQSLEFQVSE